MTFSEASPSAGIKRERLLLHFVASLRDVIVSSDDVSADMARAEVALELLDALLTDDHPTPQLSRGPRSALTIEWLVDGRTLAIEVISPSEIRMWAEGPSGDEMFDYDLNRNWEPDDGAIRDASGFLADLTQDVRNRVRLREG